MSTPNGPYQPYQQQPQYPPPYPQHQAPRRKRHLARWLLIVPGSLVALIIVAGIVGAHGKTPPKAESAATARAGAAAVRHATAQAPTPGPSAVARFSGSGIENTPQFTVSGTWKLVYSYWGCAGGSGNFIVDEDGGGDPGGASVDALSSGGSSSTWVYDDSGTHYLSVDSECSWRLLVSR